MNKVRLSKVAKIDRTVASKADCQILPYVGLEHLEKESGQFIPSFRPLPDTNLLAAKFKFTPKHILYGKLRPYLNKVTAPTFTGVCTTEILPILVDDDQLSRGYLYAILRSPTFVEWASSAVSGANLPRLDPKQLAQYEIPFPPLPEQKRIAAILDKADRLRRQRRFAQTLSDSFLQSVFFKMFGDPVANPMDWEQIVFGKWIKLKSGDFLNAVSMDRKGSFPVYGGNGINGYHSSFLFEEEKIVIGRVGAYCGAVHYTEPFSWITDNALYVLRKTSDLSDMFLVCLLRYLNLNQFAGQSGQPLISEGRLEGINLIAPPLPLQEKFAAIVQKFERIRRQQREATRQAEHLFQTLLHRAFRGEL
jgi:type I restriction enzyme, S subunit